MKTPTAFHKRNWNRFANSNLGNDVEKHLTNCQDNDGKIRAYWGILDQEEFKKENDGDEIAEPYFIDIGQDSYFYENLTDRNTDLGIFKDMVLFFRKLNNLSSKELVYIP